jgi:hypothetical protein
MNKTTIFTIVLLLTTALFFYQFEYLPQQESNFNKMMIKEIYEQNKSYPEIFGNGLGRIEYSALIPDRTLQFVITIEDESKIEDFKEYIKTNIKPTLPFERSFNAKTVDLITEYNFNFLYTIKNKSGKVVSELRIKKEDFK